MNDLIQSASRFAVSSIRHARGGVSSVLKNIGVDTKLQFSLEPPASDSGHEQWVNAMRAVAKLPDGMPLDFRQKLWLTLADNYIDTLTIDWPQVRKQAFNERLNPDDDKLGMQIIKDLHRTGWSGCGGDRERVLLKRVLLGYARYNKTVGYCQGFNVIAALILEVMEYKEDNALKVMIMLIERVLPCGYFDQTLRALSVDMAVLRDLMRQRLPRLSAHLDVLQQTSESEYEPPLPNVFSMQWFLTLFATSLPKHTVFRVWDSLMLEGSEVLLRTAIAIWARISRGVWVSCVVSLRANVALIIFIYGERKARLFRRVCKAKTADEFYCLMAPLAQDLLRMNSGQSNELLQMIYNMAEFPYPGLSELRERYTWNIQPLSSTFRLFRTQVQQILQPGDTSEADDGGMSITDRQQASSGEKGLTNENRSATDLLSLQKQYKHLKERQKQAAIILQDAYSKGQKQITSRMNGHAVPKSEVFNHLYANGSVKRVVHVGALDGIVPLSSKSVQPGAARRKTTEARICDDSSTVAGMDTPSTPSPDTEGRFNHSPFTEDRRFCDGLPMQRSSSFDLGAFELDQDLFFSGAISIRRSYSCIDLVGPTTAEQTSMGENQSRNPVDVPTTVYYSERMCKKRVSPKLRNRFEFSVVPTSIKEPPVDFFDVPVYPPMMDAGGKKRSSMLQKSKQMLDSMPGPDKMMSHNPFPVRHKSKLIEKEKKLGLY